MKTRQMLAIVAMALTWGCGQYVDYAGDGPAARVAPVEPLGDFPQAERLGHYPWAGLVAAFTSRDASGTQVYLDYGRLQGDEEARYTLRRYLAQLATVDPAQLTDARERQAFWINAYNAAVVAGVLDDLDEGRQLEGFSVLDDPQFFDHRAYTFGADIEGQEAVVLSLNHIEQGVLRGDWDHDSLQGLEEEALEQIERWHLGTLAAGETAPDARLHAALNCAALSCPNLLDKSPYVYLGAALDQQLEAQTRAWLADPGKGAGPEGLSQLFTWYAEDFDGEGGVEDFLRAHRDGGLEGVDVDGRLEYDWTLNAPPR